MNVRVTKEFKFEMAHALLDHDGPCKNIHGHSYQLAVTLKGQPMNDLPGAKAGMVIDFSDIKKIVNQEIVLPFDHALVLNKNTPSGVYSGLQDQKLILVDFQPTCENILIHFAKKLNKLFPAAMLHHLILRETSTSYAEWHAADNNQNKNEKAD